MTLGVYSVVDFRLEGTCMVFKRILWWNSVVFVLYIVEPGNIIYIICLDDVGCVLRPIEIFGAALHHFLGNRTIAFPSPTSTSSTPSSERLESTKADDDNKMLPANKLELRWRKSCHAKFTLHWFTLSLLFRGCAGERVDLSGVDQMAGIDRMILYEVDLNWQSFSESSFDLLLAHRNFMAIITRQASCTFLPVCQFWLWDFDSCTSAWGVQSQNPKKLFEWRVIHALLISERCFYMAQIQTQFTKVCWCRNRVIIWLSMNG
jgi:hypothetical protein